MISKFLKALIILSRLKFFKIFINLIENVACKFILLNKKKLYSNFLSILQLFSSGQIYSDFRKKKFFIYHKTKINSHLEKTIKELHNQSYSFLGKISKDEVQNGLKYFLSQNQIYNSHVPHGIEGGAKILMNEFLSNENCNYGSFDIRTNVNFDKIKEIIKNFKMREIAEEYLLTKDLNIYSINTMLSKKSKIPNGVCNLHRDLDSMSSITFFIYWTNVNKSNGSTLIYPGSQLFNQDKLFSNFSFDSINLKHIEGEEGSIFAVDTWAWHRANKEIETNRLVTWVRFSACPANTYFLDDNYKFKEDLNKINS